jgi:hypothetical protein
MFPNQLKNIQIKISPIPKQDLIVGVKIIYMVELLQVCNHNSYNKIDAKLFDTFIEVNIWVNLTLQKINMERILDK